MTLIVAQNPAYQHDDARALVQFYADHLTAADSVIAWSYADRYDLAYYWDRLGVTAQRITLPEGADLDAVLPLLAHFRRRGAQRLVHPARRLSRDDGLRPRQRDGQSARQQTVYGMTTLVYHDPLLDLPQLQPADLTFSD